MLVAEQITTKRNLSILRKYYRDSCLTQVKLWKLMTQDTIQINGRRTRVQGADSVI